MTQYSVSVMSRSEAGIGMGEMAELVIDDEHPRCPDCRFGAWYLRWWSNLVRWEFLCPCGRWRTER